MSTRALRRPTSRFLCACMALTFTAALRGQTGVPATPAHWSVTDLPTKPLAPSAKFHVQLKGRIDPGWHIYALEEPEDGPTATVVGLSERDPAILLGVDESAPRLIYDPFFHLQTGLFETDVAFTLQLQLPPKPVSPDSALHIRVRYQSCNDKLCLPPHTEVVELPLRPLLR